MTMALAVWLGMAVGASAQTSPGTAWGYQFGPWSQYQTPSGPVTGYQHGPWSQYQTPEGPVTGYRHGAWSQYQTPNGLVTGYQIGSWTQYETPNGPIMGYRAPGGATVFQGPGLQPMRPLARPSRPVGLMLPSPPANWPVAPGRIR
jgi:hypothetical protein